MNRSKKILLATLGAFTLSLCVLATRAGATCPGKTWSSSEVPKAADLNANFNYVCSNFVGNQGARLVNADVASNAAISTSKISSVNGPASNGIIPHAWALVNMGTPCSGSTSATCIIAASKGITSIVGAGTSGLYNVTLGYTATDPFYAPIITAIQPTAATYATCKVVVITSATVFQIQCFNGGAYNTQADTNFSILVMDDN